MITNTAFSVLFGTLLLVNTVPDVASYSKYGRTCKDIGCRTDEECVMAEDPCTRYSQNNCGSYPTCRKAHAGEASCTSIVCAENEYCRSENGVPKCVQKTTGIGYESAGVSYVNGQRVSGDDTSKTSGNTHTNTNPYANANAPPAPPLNAGGGYHQVNSGTNLGYPPYPSSGSSGSNSGYPPYPSTNQGGRQQDLGYPPYPTHDRMPMPGGSGYPLQTNPGYPGQARYPPQSSGYPQQQYPTGQRYPGQYPGYSNYPYQNYPNQNHRGYTYSTNSVYRRNAGVEMVPSVLTVFLTGLFLFFVSRT